MAEGKVMCSSYAVCKSETGRMVPTDRVERMGSSLNLDT